MAYTPLICNSVSAIFVPLRCSSCWMYVDDDDMALLLLKNMFEGDCSVSLPPVVWKLTQKLRGGRQELARETRRAR